MPTFRLTIEYDGSGFSGWQRQPSARTVQGEIERALAVILRAPVGIQGAGRTDAGVHALGQVASFVVDTGEPDHRIQRGLNALLRPEIAVTKIARVKDEFNARFDSTGKHYRYQILNRTAPSPLLHKVSLFVPVSLDLSLMERAAKKLEGTHDFNGFRARDCGRTHTVRTIHRVSLSERENGLILVDVTGDGFLKNMVRIIAGTLIEVGKKRLFPEVIQAVFETGDRRKAGPTAPAKGLSLVRVFYPDDC